MTQLIVNEIFHSIQGESSHAGRPCVFVRLAFCNLRCSYCDTEYAFHEGAGLEIGEIVERVATYRCRLVEVTGGEPLVQEGVHSLLTCLCDHGFEVLLETGGSLDIGAVDSRVKRIIDFKCPGSGMAKCNRWENIGHLRSTDEVKFVVGSREDFEWASGKIRAYAIDRKCAVLFSPVFDVLSPAQLAEWVREEPSDCRLQLQMHKYIWAPEMRGV